ncbi:hypothetical protein FCIRC_5374 [Fusarium circinatum]|uniref:Uncharacterized protein n=1 Tax=Fusarium circinatum TaxID=48490 RepID=A0A8H5U0I1_FUSCI|nr:hypothetical protein FCIRC_5374 [Fusarium circinatum]
MEPLTKKRRRGSPAQKEVQDESDDDELASHPQEIRMRRDPDIQLALKRANADHKLQATMAHIIEKYSRDFEGIGDEIDMRTGEIVVNNGHLRNMRDEGDVEGLWMEGDSNIDEDEGVLLEDLTDGCSDSEEPVKGVQHSRSEHQNNQESTFAEQGAPTSQRTHSEVSQEALQADMATTIDPSRINNAMLHASESQFGPPPYGPGSSVGFGPIPGFGPWRGMHGFPMQAWGRDDIPPYFNMPPSMPGPWFTGGRYDFPAHNGQTSIWSRNRAKKTKRAGSMKASSKQAITRIPSSSRAEEEAVADDHHRSVSEQQSRDNQEDLAPDRTINDTDEDDDLMFSETTEVASTSEASLILPTKESPAKGEVHQLSQGALEETNGNAVKVPQQNDEEDDSGRRRSGRARKQTEYMGKISWDDAKEWQKSGQRLRVELYKADPAVHKDFESVDHVGDECASSSEELQGNALGTSTLERGTTSQRRVIPDSQDTATPFNSSAPEAPERKVGTDRLYASDIPTVPSMELSDDEAPLVLSRIRAPKRQAEPGNPLSPVMPTDDRIRTAEPIVHVARSTKPNQRATSIVEPTVGGTQDQTIEPLKRKRGRPKGSTRKAQNTNTVSSTNAIASGPPAPQQHDSGALKTSNPDIEIESEDHSTYGTRTHGCPDRDEESLPKSDNDVTETEERPVTHHLTSELKWLLKTKPKSPVSYRPQAKTTDETIKSRRSRERLQKSSSSADESTELNEEISDDQREQPPLGLLQEPNTIPEGPMEAPESVITVGDDQSSTACPSSPGHVEDSPSYSDHSDDNGSRLNDSSSDYAPPQDEAVHDEESLPELPRDIMVQEASTPRKPKDTRAPLTEPPSSSHKPHTPRHASIRTTRAPSSRRSLLSFVSDSESDTGEFRDELARRVKSASKTAYVRRSTKRIWRASALTREVQRTPSRKRFREMSSPTSTVKTPGGTLRTCGIDGYQCGRDFCFSCI